MKNNQQLTVETESHFFLSLSLGNGVFRRKIDVVDCDFLGGKKKQNKRGKGGGGTAPLSNRIESNSIPRRRVAMIDWLIWFHRITSSLMIQWSRRGGGGGGGGRPRFALDLPTSSISDGVMIRAEPARRS